MAALAPALSFEAAALVEPRVRCQVFPAPPLSSSCDSMAASNPSSSASSYPSATWRSTSVLNPLGYGWITPCFDRGFVSISFLRWRQHGFRSSVVLPSSCL